MSTTRALMRVAQEPRSRTAARTDEGHASEGRLRAALSSGPSQPSRRALFFGSVSSTGDNSCSWRRSMCPHEV
jgi:hypothetical protein